MNKIHSRVTWHLKDSKKINKIWPKTRSAVNDMDWKIWDLIPKKNIRPAVQQPMCGYNTWSNIPIKFKIHKRHYEDIWINEIVSFIIGPEAFGIL